MASCNHTSNNKYFNCPALMADGRVFTDYRPSGYVNDLIRIQNGLTNSYDYRQFLIHYASDLMTAEQSYLDDKVGSHIAGPAIVPLQTECVYDTQSGLCFPSDPNGIGLSNAAVPQLPARPYRPNPQ